MEKLKIPFEERICMTVEEAAAYSLIGENCLRAIIARDRYEKRLDWPLYIGNCTRVKREPFKKWVLEQSFL